VPESDLISTVSLLPHPLQEPLPLLLPSLPPHQLPVPELEATSMPSQVLKPHLLAKHPHS